MKYCNADETAKLLPYETLIRSVRQGIVQNITVPERQHHAIPVADGTTRTLITMPAWSDEGHLAIKLVNVSPGNAKLGLPAISAIHILFDAKTGEPVMMLDGAELTARRTAIIAALGGDALASRDAKTHLIVGAGAVARHLPGAYRAIRKFERTMIWARRIEQAHELVEALSAEGIEAHAISSLQEAAGQADVISCATMAREPLLKGEWLKTETHLDLIGAYLPEMREADDDVLIGARIWADALPGALTDSGELADPLARGIIHKSQVQGDLAKLLSRVEKCAPSGLRTIFKTVGNARWDYLCTRHLLN